MKAVTFLIILAAASTVISNHKVHAAPLGQLPAELIIMPIATGRVSCKVGSNSENQLIITRTHRKISYNGAIELVLGSKVSMRRHLRDKQLSSYRMLQKELRACKQRKSPYNWSLENNSKEIPAPPNNVSQPDAEHTPDLPPDPINEETPYISPSRIKPILSFLWPAGSPYAVTDIEEQNQLLKVTQFHYSTAPTSPSSQGHFAVLEQYRSRALQTNPSLGLGVYMSAVTTSNPINHEIYVYSQLSYRDHDNNPATPALFMCNTPGYLYHSGYLASRRPDSHAFIDLHGMGEFQPMDISSRSQEEWAPWGTATFAWWPFEHFSARNWLLPGTDLYCRPTFDFRRPEVQQFIISNLLEILESTPQFRFANMITFDNAAMLTNPRYDFWPGKGDAMSPYSSVSPENDFINYLNAVRSALNDRGMRLAINGGSGSQALAGSADVMFFEDSGISRSTSSEEFSRLLRVYRTFIEAQTAVVPYFLNGHVGYSSNREEIIYFLASSMLVYEDGYFSFYPDMYSSNMPGYTPENAVAMRGEYFYLPTCLGEPAEKYRQGSSNGAVYFRRFTNGVVVANSSAIEANVPSELSGVIGNLSATIPAKSAVIRILNCSCLKNFDPDFESSCRILYQHQQ